MTKKDIAQRIGLIRVRKNLSARELSGRIGKSEGYISSLECSNFSVPIDILLDILLVCETSAEEFFYGQIENYRDDKKLLDAFKKINPEQKQLLFNLMGSFK